MHPGMINIRGVNTASALETKQNIAAFLHVFFSENVLTMRDPQRLPTKTNQQDNLQTAFAVILSSFIILDINNYIS